MSTRFETVRRYWAHSSRDRGFVALRTLQTPYDRLADLFPKEGSILDLACGHGFLSLALAWGSAGRRVVGIDHDGARIKAAQAVARGIPNLEFRAQTYEQTLSAGAAGEWDGVALIDSLHYLREAAQDGVIAGIARAIKPGGRFVFREVDPTRGISSTINGAYERLATGLGFTKGRDGLFFRSQAQWTALLESHGLRVVETRHESLIFADVVYVCDRGK